GLGPRPLRF
uniref:FMRFamide-like neuropeptide AF9 n=1 Tax=Ascaris suum TaxID=6253 RepID=FAR9_ASCSU|nr:RecName: Full=FMRFamide-like neuropeptide AF9 [Ascaris suum]